MRSVVVRACLASLLLAGGACAGAAQVQTSAESCTKVKDEYTCSWPAFRARFAQVRTVAIEPRPIERFEERRLTELVQALGKSAAGPGQPADLVFRVVPATETGIAFGPADQPLARLEVLVPGQDGGRATLLWVETLVGQADRPWPTVVNALADQFGARFHHNGR